MEKNKLDTTINTIHELYDEYSGGLALISVIAMMLFM